MNPKSYKAVKKTALDEGSSISSHYDGKFDRWLEELESVRRKFKNLSEDAAYKGCGSCASRAAAVAGKINDIVNEFYNSGVNTQVA